MPYLRFSIQVIGLFLVSRLLDRRTLREAAAAASQPNMPYQRGQFWVRRFQQQTATLCVALVSLTTVVPAADFLTRALQMLEGIGWIVAHRFLFAELRAHLLGWPRFLVPHGCRINLAGFLQCLIRKHTTFVLATRCEPARVTDVESRSWTLLGKLRSACTETIATRSWNGVWMAVG